MNYRIAEQKIKGILTKSKSTTILQDVVDVLHESFEKYSWVGIYRVKGDVLVLGPWKGKQATEHTKIPIGKGVCGSAARSGKIEVVADVSKDSRYLSCFRSTRSEIVVPIKKKNRVIGEIDIDSDVSAAFNKTDELFLEKIADMLRQHI
ncbi:MAG: GAF domain-containing protein [Thermoplasmata archaeon]|nr:GAF domain-containing protein [Thermoplasmata archaeon]MBE3137838.1 GAF domain-containing protein [Thermoplasmata archaeon]MBE3139967.1 GAF domain-containing protein [Thermoplasmata archaeon]